MSSKPFGWCGKILKVDLSDSRITELDTMDYAERFLGGRGIATRIYWEEVGPDVGALDPENCLILMNGPLGATGALGASRGGGGGGGGVRVVGKSPMLMPEGFCYGNLGGYFPPGLEEGRIRRCRDHRMFRATQLYLDQRRQGRDKGCRIALGKRRL